MYCGGSVPATAGRSPHFFCKDKGGSHAAQERRGDKDSTAFAGVSKNIAGAEVRDFFAENVQGQQRARHK